jgi:hypothetical protein
MAEPKDDQAFDRWMHTIDEYLLMKVGVARDDLPDAPYRDWYDDGIGPITAAKRAIRLARD